MVKECALCTIPEMDEYRVLTRNSLVCSVVPWEPLKEGHVIVFPVRHILMKDLTTTESKALETEIIRLKEKITRLYPAQSPLMVISDGTKDCSIPEHLHYHIVPSTKNIRVLFSIAEDVAERQRQDEAVLATMAEKLRE